VSRSSCLDVALPCIHRPALPRPARRSRAVLVRAEIPQPKGVVAGLRSSCTKFLQVGGVLLFCSQLSMHGPT